MRLSRPPGVVVAALLGLSLTLTAAGCADDAEPTSESAAEETSDTSPTESAESPETPETTPSTPMTTQETEPTQTASSAAAGAVPADPASLLLPADRVGKLNAEWRWAVGNDSDTEPKGLAACHRARLTDLGANRVAVREYTSDLDANVAAFHLVAATPDAKTAKRLYAVLESWHADCQRRLEARDQGRDGVKVSDLEPVSTGAEAAATYVVFAPTATGTTQIENVGIARQGRVVTLVVVKLEGEDFNYPRGRTPAALTLRNAATG